MIRRRWVHDPPRRTSHDPLARRLGTNREYQLIYVKMDIVTCDSLLPMLLLGIAA
jgi:hypothetical protein